MLEHLLGFPGDIEVHFITEAHLSQFMNIRAAGTRLNTKRPPTRVTLNQRVAVLTSSGHFLERVKSVEVSPARDLRQKREDDLRTNWVASEAELAAWRKELSGTPRCVFDVLVRTAMRLSEHLNLRSEDYNLTAKVFHLHNTKGCRTKRIPASPFVQGIVEPRLAGEWLLSHERTGQPYRAAGVHSIFYRARDKTGLRKFTVTWEDNLGRGCPTVCLPDTSLTIQSVPYVPLMCRPICGLASIVPSHTVGN